jgi:hypothetical protein
MANATTVTKPLAELLRGVDDDELVLPEIQRDFIWTRKSVMLLFDSLYRGLPIGHMLVWKAKRLVPVKPFRREGQQRTRVSVDGFYGYLLDGQQRLTALARVRDADEGYRLMFYAWPRRDEEGADFFEWENRSNKTDDWYVDVAEVLQGKFNILRYLERLKKNEFYEPTNEKRTHDELVKLTQILDRSIGVIEFETEDYREATQLFIRFNSTGRKLSKGDLFVAELAVKVPGLTSDDLRKVAHKWPGFSFTVPFLAQCLLAVHSGRLKTKAREAWGDENPIEVKESWRKTARGLSHAIGFLTGTVRWQSADLIPSFNALIPLVAIAANNDGIRDKDRALARRWLLLAGVHSHFSGSVHTELDRLLRRLQKDMSVRELWKATSKYLRRLRAGDFEVSRISGPVTSLYLSMLADGDARDWKDPTFRLDGQVHGHNAKLQVHHFFPRALLRKHGVGQDRINTFANYTVLSAGTNLEVGAEEPGTYMKRHQVPEKQLDAQCIPRDEGLWRVGRYDEFVAERRRLLAERANEFLGV